jgi:hypothetical protein
MPANWRKHQSLWWGHWSTRAEDSGWSLAGLHDVTAVVVLVSKG